jgi:N-acetyltransferase 10
VLAKFQDTLKKMTKNILQIMQKTIESEMLDERQLNHGKEFTPLKQTMDEELDEEARKLEKKQKKELVKLKKESLSQYAIKGTQDDWSNALKANGKKSIVSVKSGEKRGADELEADNLKDNPKTEWNKNKKKKFQPQSGGRKDKFFKK